jgi:hypothetical protein
VKEPEPEEQDRTPWVSVRISLPKNHRTLSLRDTIEEAPRNLRWEAMGAMIDLWINTFAVAWADGDLSKWRPEDVEEMIAWKGKPGEFVKALKAIGFIEKGGGIKVAGWLKHQRRALRDRLRHYEISGRQPPTGRAPSDDSAKIAERTAAARKARGS